MGLARKRCRTIVVSAAKYRWTTAPDDELGVGIVVEKADAPARRLVAWVEPGVTISPGVVRVAIERGVKSGWDPGAKGPDFILQLYGEFDPRTALKQCPCCDYFTLDQRGEHLICPVCFWEDDGLDVDQLDQRSGPNHISLREARENFRSFGACDERARGHVLPESARAKYWRVLRQTSG